MQRKRLRLRLPDFTLGCFGSALIIFAQLAPTLHALAPHEHQTSSCKHAAAQVHFEADSETDSGPCQICAHLSSSQGFLFISPLRIDEIRTVRSSAPSIQLTFDARARELPDSRGPPLPT
jgi:hypothetical protein